MADKQRISYFQKKPTTCPACEGEFAREELLSGGGRLIAGNLTEELRRNYEPSQRYGVVYPLIYPAIVCPNCFYAALATDFSDVGDADLVGLQNAAEERRNSAALIFEELDYFQPRGLREGAAGHFLAMMSYDYRGGELSPTFKRGVCALRAAWLCTDLDHEHPDEHWDYVSQLFYRKARFFYSLALEREEGGDETLEGVQHFGPDTDQNYAFEGMIYLAGLLEFRYGPRSDPDRRAAALDRSRMFLSKVFGFGKASRERPTPILEAARESFFAIDRELDELRAS